MSYDIDPQIISWEGEGGAEPRHAEPVIQTAEQLIAHGITDHVIRQTMDVSTWEAEGGALPPEHLL